MASDTVLERLVVEIVGDVSKLKGSLDQATRLTTEFNRSAKANIGTAGLAAQAKEAADAITVLRDRFERLQAAGKTGAVGARELKAGMLGVQETAATLERELPITASQAKTLGRVYSAAGRDITTAERQILAGIDSVTEAAKQQVAPWDALKKAVYNTRSDYEAQRITLKELMPAMAALQKEALAGAEGITAEAKATRAGAAAFKAYEDAAGAAARYMATASGGISRLGLSANVANASMFALSQGMYAMGPAGMALGMSVNSVGPALAGMGTAAVGAAAGVAGIGLAAGALIRVGIPQVKQMQAATQLLIASGDRFTASHLAESLDAVAASAGRAGTQFSRGQLATSLSELVKAGISASDALKVLAPGMQLAAVTGQTLNDATNLLLQNLRQFDLTAGDAGKAADELAKADLMSASSAQNLSEGLAAVGPVAKEAGLSLSDTLGILTDLSNKGLDPASTGGKAFRVVITSLLDPSAKAKKALDELGVATKTADGHQRDMRSILADLTKSLSTYGVTIDKNTGQVVGQQDAIAKLSEIFRTRGVTAAASLKDAVGALGGSWTDLADAIEKATGAAADYANTMLDNNLEAAQNSLSTALKNLGETATETFAPGLTSAANALAGFLDQMDRAAETRGLWGGLAMGLADLENQIGRAVLTPIIGKKAAVALTTKPGGEAILNSLGGVGTGQYGPPPGPTRGKTAPPSPAPAAPGQPKGTPTDPVNVRLAEPGAVVAVNTGFFSTNQPPAAALKAAKGGNYAAGAPMLLNGYPPSSLPSFRDYLQAANDLQASEAFRGEREQAARKAADEVDRQLYGPTGILGGFFTGLGSAISDAREQAAKLLHDDVQRAASDEQTRQRFAGRLTAPAAVATVAPPVAVRAPEVKALVYPYATAAAQAAMSGYNAVQDSFETSLKLAVADSKARSAAYAQQQRDEALRQANMALRQGGNYGLTGSQLYAVGQQHAGASLEATRLQGAQREAILTQQENTASIKRYTDTLNTLSEKGREAASAQRDLRRAGEGYYVPGVNHSGMLPAFSGWTSQDFMNFIFTNAPGQTAPPASNKASTELEKLANAAQTASGAVTTFSGALGAFASGNIGGGIAGLGSAAGSALGAIGGLLGTAGASLGPIGTLVSVGTDLFGGLVGALGPSGPASENSAAAAAMRANATPPALDLKFEFNQTNTLGSLTDPATQAALNRVADVAFQRFEQVLATTIVPRLKRLETAAGLSS